MPKFFMYVSCLLCACALNSCDKEKQDTTPVVPVIKCYEKFLGDYAVYNPDSHIYYNMSITHSVDTNSYGYPYDKLTLHNFANLFNLDINFTCTNDSSNQGDYLGIGAHDSIPDFYNNRWFLFQNFHDSLNNPVSRLHNDSLTLSFYMCNIKFYIYDATPYFCKNVFHHAVKVH